MRRVYHFAPFGLFRVLLILLASGALPALLSGQEEPVPVKIRTLGVGVNGLRLGSAGFADGKTLFMGNRSLNGPIYYFGPSQLQVVELNQSGASTGKSHTLQLPQSKIVLLVGISPPNSSEVRLLALPDDYGELSKRTISVLNITSMPIYIKLGESMGRVESGAAFRESFQLADDQKRLNITMVGDSGNERVPLVNSRLRILPGRDLTIVVTGVEMAPDSSFAQEQVELMMLYHAPILKVKEVETDAEGTNTIQSTVTGGDPDA